MDLLDREQAKQAIENMKQNEDIVIEQAQVSANILRHYYNALKDNGFTPEEAIKLVAAHGLTMGAKGEQ